MSGTCQGLPWATCRRSDPRRIPHDCTRIFLTRARECERLTLSSHTTTQLQCHGQTQHVSARTLRAQLFFFSCSPLLCTSISWQIASQASITGLKVLRLEHNKLSGGVPDVVFRLQVTSELSNLSPHSSLRAVPSHRALSGARARVKSAATADVPETGRDKGSFKERRCAPRQPCCPLTFTRMLLLVLRCPAPRPAHVPCAHALPGRTNAWPHTHARAHAHGCSAVVHCRVCPRADR